MEQKNLRIEANGITYAILKEEQQKCQDANQKKVALADILLHYFHEGNNHASKHLENGLRVFDDSLPKVTMESLPQLYGDENINNIQLLNMFLAMLDNRGKEIVSREHQVNIREKEVYEELKLNNVSNDSSVLIHQVERSHFETELLKKELRYIKQELNDVRNKDSINGSEFRKIQRSLNLIEIQTKKTTLDSIMPFITPIMILLGGLVLNKKLDKKIGIEDFRAEIKSIFSELDGVQKKSLTDLIGKSISGVL